jgi:hypothetical protein
MTTQTLSWIVIGANALAAGFNAFAFWRYLSGWNRWKREADALQRLTSDTLNRIANGEILVTTDDGVVGTLVITPEGGGNLRLSVEPLETRH